jgi:hypothetical protein
MDSRPVGKSTTLRLTSFFFHVSSASARKVKAHVYPVLPYASVEEIAAEAARIGKAPSSDTAPRPLTIERRETSVKLERMGVSSKQRQDQNRSKQYAMQPNDEHGV